MIFDKHANLKYKYGNRTFWAWSYYKEFMDPFTGNVAGRLCTVIGS